MSISKEYIRQELERLTAPDKINNHTENLHIPALSADDILKQGVSSRWAEDTLLRGRGALGQSVIHFLFANKEFLKKLPLFGGLLVSVKDKLLRRELEKNMQPASIDLSDCISWYADDFINECYWRLLGREADESGRAAYQQLIRQGAENRVVAYAIAQSAEFGQRAPIVNLAEYKRVYKSFFRKLHIKKMPVIGRIVAALAVPSQIMQLYNRLERTELLLNSSLAHLGQQSAAQSWQIQHILEQLVIDKEKYNQELVQQHKELAEQHKELTQLLADVQTEHKMFVHQQELAQQTLRELVQQHNNAERALAQWQNTMQQTMEDMQAGQNQIAQGQAESLNIATILSEKMDSSMQIATSLSEKMDSNIQTATVLSEKMDSNIQIAAGLADKIDSNIQIATGLAEKMDLGLNISTAISEKSDTIINRNDILARQIDALSANFTKNIMGYTTNTNPAMERIATNNKIQNEKATEISSESNDDMYTVLDYFKFQNEFRGSRTLITERQQMYVPYFKDAQKPVLDIGCGRGEFLVLMRENNIPAFGIDMYSEYVVEGTLNNIDIRQGDGLEFLQNTEDKFGGIFVCQVIEHITFQQLQRLCSLAYDKLVSGAYLILETPNPRSLSMFTGGFYVDPTHNKPVHPATVQYLLKEIGFADVKIEYTESGRPTGLPKIQADGIKNLNEINDGIERVSNMLFGSLDYAAIARKP